MELRPAPTKKVPIEVRYDPQMAYWRKFITISLSFIFIVYLFCIVFISRQIIRFGEQFIGKCTLFLSYCA